MNIELLKANGFSETKYDFEPDRIFMTKSIKIKNLPFCKFLLGKQWHEEDDVIIVECFDENPEHAFIQGVIDCTGYIFNAVSVLSEGKEMLEQAIKAESV